MTLEKIKAKIRQKHWNNAIEIFAIAFCAAAFGVGIFLILDTVLLHK